MFKAEAGNLWPYTTHDPDTPWCQSRKEKYMLNVRDVKEKLTYDFFRLNKMQSEVCGFQGHADSDEQS